MKYEAKFHSQNCFSRSREGAWIEMPALVLITALVLGRSREGAWIEMSVTCYHPLQAWRRSREGAWIEMMRLGRALVSCCVAPARERGLKFSAHPN